MLTNNITFKKKVKMTIWGSVGIILLGILTVAMWRIYLEDKSFIDGFYIGLGGGLLGAGIATLIKNIRYLRNSQIFNKAEVEYNDERIRHIKQRTWSISGFIFMVLLYIAVIVSGLFNLIVIITLLGTLGVFLLILLVVNIILKKIY